MARIEDQREDKRSKPSTGRFTSFTSLTTSINQVLIQIKDEGVLTFLGKLKGDPNKGPKKSTVVFTMTTVMIRLTTTT